FAEPILDCEIRRTVVPRLEGRIRRGISRLITARTNHDLRSGLHRLPVVLTPITWAVVARLIHRHAPPPIVKPTATAAIGGLRDLVILYARQMLDNVFARG